MWHIAIVDDSELIRERLAKVISKLPGVDRVSTARSVKEAKVLFDSEQLDIVILDIRFPDGSGISLLRRLMAQDKPPTVIVFTSFPYPAYRKKCMDMGAYCFLEKSEEFQKVPKIIHEIMKQEHKHAHQ